QGSFLFLPTFNEANQVHGKFDLRPRLEVIRRRSETNPVVWFWNPLPEPSKALLPKLMEHSFLPRCELSGLRELDLREGNKRLVDFPVDRILWDIFVVGKDP